MKRIVCRVKVNSYWCSIYASILVPEVWNLGLVVNKSKRASNDWYQRRNNKRYRRAVKEKKLKSLKEMRGCLIALQKVLAKIPTGHNIFIFNDFQKARNLSEYVIRLGFVPAQHENRIVWVLTAQKREEAQHYFLHTN